MSDLTSKTATFICQTILIFYSDYREKQPKQSVLLILHETPKSANAKQNKNKTKQNKMHAILNDFDLIVELKDL